MVVSSEMPELLGICDRILVMSGGRLAGEVDAQNTTQERNHDPCSKNMYRRLRLVKAITNMKESYANFSGNGQQG